MEVVITMFSFKSLKKSIFFQIVIPAARKQYMSDKIPYVFRQNSDFFYLTGCMEPSAILVIVKQDLSDNYTVSISSIILNI